MASSILTSTSHPIRVDFLSREVAPLAGRIGMTFAPGKHQPGGASGHWERDLSIDARDLAEKYGTNLLVSLVEDHELRELRIERLVAAFAAHDIRVLRRPFPDLGVPTLEMAKTTVSDVLEAVGRGKNVVIHCKGGLGRTGLIAACALVASGVDAASAMRAVRDARPDTIENQTQVKFIEAFDESGFRFMPASAIKPLDRLSISAKELMAAHPPQWKDGNKRIVFDISSPPGSVHGGQISYSRFAAMALPSRVDTRAAGSRLVHRPGYYDYAPLSGGTVEWHVNFADSSLFGFYGGALFAQDEMQAVEHPALGALRETLVVRGMKAVTKEGDKATPVLVVGVERRCRVATNPDAASGRPKGLYGNEFARASESAIRAATTRVDPPTVSNLICVAAPKGGPGAYMREEIEGVLVTAYSGFRAAMIESGSAVIHTGWWGCGAFGGNRVLMGALQLLAAEMAEVEQLVLHSGEPADEASANEAARILWEIGGRVDTGVVVDQLVAMRLMWGKGNGT